MSQMFNLISQGGPVFMLPILAMLILIIVLIVKGILNRENDNTKTISLISSIGLFTLVWGVLGQVIGLIGGFDAIEAAGNVSPGMMAAGLKVSFLTTLFGLIVFLVARLGIIFLIWKKE
jgi:flagellar motor component MotA